MDDYQLLMLLLFLLIVAAYLLKIFEFALKLQEEPTEESIRKQINLSKIQYLNRHKELIKSAIMQINLVICVAISYIVLILIKEYVNSDIVNIYWQYIISGVISSTIFVIFLNLIPSVTFTRIKDSLTGLLYYPVLTIMWIMYPASTILIWLRNKSLSGLIDTDDKPISIEELSDAVDIVSKVNTSEDKRILSGMVKFVNADVEDIMHHRSDILSIDISAKFSDIKMLFRESGFSRIPVYNGDSDHIEGIIHLKDILPYVESSHFNWQSIIHKPLFASSDSPISDLLLLFQSKKEHMAIVVDEYGSTLGLVTLEDVLEEIVGEIHDEFDEEEVDGCQEMQDGTFMFEGKTPIQDFLEDVELQDSDTSLVPEDVETVAGLVVELLEDFPEVGASVIFNENLKLTVISMDRHRIDKIKVEKNEIIDGDSAN